jgi:hypothetical protein
MTAKETLTLWWTLVPVPTHSYPLLFSCLFTTSVLDA